MQITEMSASDAGELAELDKLCFSVPWSEKSFYEESQNHLARYFVARINDEIVAYAGVWIVCGEGQISNIAVHPKYRKNGIATALLEKIIEECKDLFQIVLEVRESNGAAISLYEKFGFKREGIRKNFYHTPKENAAVMIRKMN